MENQNELNSQDLKNQNKFNKALNRCFHITPTKDIIIRGIKDDLFLTPENQENILKCLLDIEINKELGIEPSFLEQIAIEVLFRDTY